MFARTPGHAAVADIADDDCTPSHRVTLGSSGGRDSFSDVAVTVGAVWACGVTAPVTDATEGLLTRLSRTDWSSVSVLYDGVAHGDDLFDCLAPGPGGVVCTAGETTTAAGRDLLLVKWSATGTRLWVRRYDGPAHGADTARDVAVDRDGNVIVCGASHGTDGSPDWVVASWRADGSRRWVWRLAGKAGLADAAADLAVDRAGTVYVTGTVVAAGPTSAVGVARLGRDGRPLWTRTWNGEGLGASGAALARLPAGGVAVAGWDAVTGPGRTVSSPPGPPPAGAPWPETTS